MGMCRGRGDVVIVSIHVVLTDGLVQIDAPLEHHGRK